MITKSIIYRTFNSFASLLLYMHDANVLLPKLFRWKENDITRSNIFPSYICINWMNHVNVWHLHCSYSSVFVVWATLICSLYLFLQMCIFQLSPFVCIWWYAFVRPDVFWTQWDICSTWIEYFCRIGTR